MSDKPTPADAEILDAAERYRNAIASAAYEAAAAELHTHRPTAARARLEGNA